MTTIKFRDWEFIVDKELTKQTYAKIEGGWADGCTCNECKNFANNRVNIYPQEIKNLFMSLGIDYQKECEVSHYGIDGFGRDRYRGWFHFKGYFKGKSLSSVPESDQTPTSELTPINNTFGLGFLYDSFSTFFENKENLVQVEFETFTSWTIDRELEFG